MTVETPMRDEYCPLLWVERPQAGNLPHPAWSGSRDGREVVAVYPSGLTQGGAATNWRVTWADASDNRATKVSFPTREAAQSHIDGLDRDEFDAR